MLTFSATGLSSAVSCATRTVASNAGEIHPAPCKQPEDGGGIEAGCCLLDEPRWTARYYETTVLERRFLSMCLPHDMAMRKIRRNRCSPTATPVRGKVERDHGRGLGCKGHASRCHKSAHQKIGSAHIPPARTVPEKSYACAAVSGCSSNKACFHGKPESLGGTLTQ